MNEKETVQEDIFSPPTPPKENKYNKFLTKIVRTRLWRQNKNWLCLICGAPGTGKSYASLKEGEEIDPNFSIENVVFSADKFMERLNSGEIKRGSCIVFDEAGVGIPTRDWYTMSNKMINYILQTFRHENLAVIFTVPDISFIDSQPRKLFNTYIETKRIDYKNKILYTKLFAIQNNPITGKIYRKYYHVDGLKINPYCIGKPSDKLVKAYEAKKKEFAVNLRKDAERMIKETKKIKEKEDDVFLTDFDIAKILMDDKKKLDGVIKSYRGRNIIDRFLLQSKYGLSEIKSIRVKKLVEEDLRNKGEL